MLPQAGSPAPGSHDEDDTMTRTRLTLALAFLLVTMQTTAAERRPNVLLVITDDQGYGDFGVHGNPQIRTPRLDGLARESVRLTRFHVSPVCSPTRASLLTGRYHDRTRVVDTFRGRSMMEPDETTLAEMLSAAGYRTGIFGKWHLGDCYPMRAVDQGFQEALVLKGGGIGQPSDPPGGTSYFDPVLQHNGRPEKRKGYVSDVITDAVIEFIKTGRPASQPFFAYLAFNAPHVPLEVPEADLAAYAKTDLSNAGFPATGYPLEPIPRAQTERVYAMVSNIDANVGRVLDTLDALKIADDTIVVFLTDNGPQQVRYNGGMRGRKGTVYDGGIRVPCFVRWPGRLTPGREVDRIAAHIDVTPTLLDACGVSKPPGLSLDGVSLLPLLKGTVQPADWPSRTLYLHWHRGDAPEKFRAFAAREPRYKLVRAEGPTAPLPAAFELFDMEADPSETRDVSAAHPEVVARMKAAYERWFDDVGKTRGFDPPRIHLGSAKENPTVLTRQDWRGSNGLEHWEVEVERGGDYRVTLRPTPAAGVVRLSLGEVSEAQPIAAGATSCVFDKVRLHPGAGRIRATYAAGSASDGAWSVDVERLD